ncbi:alpha/beta hydrolase [Stappia sp. MMSF_3263]|uniref:serine aminopeptidase domain-containing protein n=1 Tax=Stappia sp. MMSF_3263 TaxID=3046693 RepID=UPI00273FFEDA|nr:alpha/beta hydrolase [Stappia sp. MMSF_3263]
MQRLEETMNRRALEAMRPLCLAQTFAQLHPAEGDVGIVICEPWGYEALCARRSLRILADRLAGLGYPVLRYDQPGSGDAAAEAADIDGLEPFQATLAEACDTLRRVTGVRAVVLVGLGLGAALAARHAEIHPGGTSGLVLLAPVVKGRTWLREVQARAMMIGELTGSAPEPRAGEALAIAGLPMSEGLAGEIRGLDISATALAGDLPVLVLARDGRPAELALAASLCADAESGQGVMAGYDEMMGDPTGAVPPLADFGRVEAWLQHARPCRPGNDAGAAAPALPPAVLGIDGVTEEALVFGAQENLYGIWCAPRADAVPGMRPVILLNAGGVPHAGWARGTVELARGLARSGIASLRFDVADIGDSRPGPGAPPVVHYHPDQNGELAAALDLALARVPADGAVVTGACGGAYLALNGAVADPRVAHVVAVNLQRFLWDPRDDVAEVLRFGHASARDYGRKMLSVEKWKRVLSGKTSAFGILRSLANRAYRTGERRLAPWLFGLLPFSRLYNTVHANLAALARRDVTVDLVFSEGDPGLAQMDLFFGAGWSRLDAFANMRVTMLADADHNLTPRAARRIVADHVTVAAAALRASEERSGDQAAE